VQVHSLKRNPTGGEIMSDGAMVVSEEDAKRAYRKRGVGA